MKVWIDDVGPCRKQLRIELTAEEVDADYNEALQAISRHAKVPGFRPGRAPKEIIERRHHNDIVRETRDVLVSKHYHGALKQEKLDVAAVLDMQEPSITKGRPASFSVTVDVPPKFDLPEYKGIALKNETRPVSDEEVQEAMVRLRKAGASYEEVTGHAAQDQDLVQVDYESTFEGQPTDVAIPEAKGLGKGTGVWLQLDPDAFLAPLAMAFKGCSAGDTKEVDVPFHETFTVAGLRGKTVHFKATMKALRQQKLPDLDEKFLDRFGAKTEDEMRKNIREEMERARAKEETERRRDEATRFLLDRTVMDHLPQSLLEQHTQRMVYDTVRRNTARGASEQNIKDQREQIYEGAQKNASTSLKARYILHKIAREENITVSDDEFRQEVAGMAARYRRSMEEMVKMLNEQNMLDNLREDILARKALDIVVHAAKIG